MVFIDRCGGIGFLVIDDGVEMIESSLFKDDMSVRLIGLVAVSTFKNPFFIIEFAGAGIALVTSEFVVD